MTGYLLSRFSLLGFFKNNYETEKKYKNIIKIISYLYIKFIIIF